MQLNKKLFQVAYFRTSHISALACIILGYRLINRVFQIFLYTNVIKKGRVKLFIEDSIYDFWVQEMITVSTMHI